MAAKTINTISALKKAGFKLVDKEDGKMEQYESDDQRVVLHKIRGVWYLFSECITPVVDEFGMRHHERCGLTLGETEKFLARMQELKEAPKSNA